jgi:hypothetical protein
MKTGTSGSAPSRAGACRSSSPHARRSKPAGAEVRGPETRRGLPLPAGFTRTQPGECQRRRVDGDTCLIADDHRVGLPAAVTRDLPARDVGGARSSLPCMPLRDRRTPFRFPRAATGRRECRRSGVAPTPPSSSPLPVALIRIRNAGSVRPRTVRITDGLARRSGRSLSCGCSRGGLSAPIHGPVPCRVVVRTLTLVASRIRRHENAAPAETGGTRRLTSGPAHRFQRRMSARLMTGS